VRRISELKGASFAHGIRESIPALHGPGLINNDQMTVPLRKTTLVCDSFGTTQIQVTCPGLNFFIRIKVIYYHTAYKCLYNTVGRALIQEVLGVITIYHSFPPNLREPFNLDFFAVNLLQAKLLED
jgi:hypothetical protein